MSALRKVKPARPAHRSQLDEFGERVRDRTLRAVLQEINRRLEIQVAAIKAEQAEATADIRAEIDRITADLRAATLTCHVDLDAPREGRATTRVNWLIRQLKNTPDSARVECYTAHARGSSSAELLRTIRDNPASLITDPTKEIRTFRVATNSNLGAKRGRGRQNAGGVSPCR